MKLGMMMGKQNRARVESALEMDMTNLLSLSFDRLLKSYGESCQTGWGSRRIAS
jgi:hypothetical protein